MTNLCLYQGASREIRTPVLALKGLRPGPLDDGGIALLNGLNFTITIYVGQGKTGFDLIIDLLQKCI